MTAPDLSEVEARLTADEAEYGEPEMYDQTIRDRRALLALVREQAAKIAEAKAEALEEAAQDFEDNMGVGEFDEWARRDGRRWAHIDDAWEYQGPYMDWLRARAASLRGES